MVYKVYDLLYLHDRVSYRKHTLPLSAIATPLLGLDYQTKGINLLKAYLKLTDSKTIMVTPFRVCNPFTGAMITDRNISYETDLLSDLERDTLDFFGSIPALTAFEHHLILKDIHSVIEGDKVALIRLNNQLLRYYNAIYAKRSRKKTFLQSYSKKK